MNHYEKLGEIKKLTDKIGKIYGTEDFAIYLYSIVKMTKPTTVVELGTGLGTTALWTALALEENEKGWLYTVDDGSEWDDLVKAKESFKEYFHPNYHDYIVNLIQHFGFTNTTFINEKINAGNLNKIDILFSDYQHSPHAVISCLANYLGRMAENSHIFIDSASTYYPSYLVLEQLIKMLNQKNIPQTLLEMVPITQIDKFKERVEKSNFQLTHLIENKDRAQNSTACIKITPKDIFPQPRVGIRF